MRTIPLETLICAVSPTREPLEWVQLAYAGRFEGHPQGPFTIRPDDIQAMAANFAADPRGRIVVDYEHQTLRSADNGQPAPAAGWCVAVEARAENSELWGKIEWTERSSKAIRAAEYSYLSPVIQWSFVDKVTGAQRGARLHSIGLTNQPFLDRLPPIANKDEMTPELLNLLGLTEAETGKAVATLQRVLRLAKVGEHALSQAGLSADLDAERACAALTPIVQHAGYVKQSVHDAVLTELAQHKSKGAAETLLNEARDKGVIVPATESWAREFATRDPDGFKRWCSAAPRVAPEPAAGHRQGPASSPTALSEDDKAMARRMGLSDESYLKALNAQKGV